MVRLPRTGAPWPVTEGDCSTNWLTVKGSFCKVSSAVCAHVERVWERLQWGGVASRSRLHASCGARTKRARAGRACARRWFIQSDDKIALGQTHDDMFAHLELLVLVAHMVERPIHPWEEIQSVLGAHQAAGGLGPNQGRARVVHPLQLAVRGVQGMQLAVEQAHEQQLVAQPPGGPARCDHVSHCCRAGFDRRPSLTGYTFPLCDNKSDVEVSKLSATSITC